MQPYNDIDFNKVEQFANNELNYLEKQSKITLIIPETTGVFRIKDWKISVIDKDTVICEKRRSDPITFANKSCAILYVINLVNNNWKTSQEVQILDETLLRMKSSARLLSHQMRNQLKKSNFEKFDLLHNQYLEIQARYRDANETVKKYYKLTKYTKGLKQ